MTEAKRESVVVTETQTPKKKSKEAKESAVVTKTGKRPERTWTPPMPTWTPTWTLPTPTRTPLTPTWPPHSRTQTKRRKKSEAAGEGASRSWRASGWWTPCT